MDFLEAMKELRLHMQTPKHALSNENISVRYPYALGIALLLAKAENTLSMEGKDWLLSFFRSMDLPDSHGARIIAEAEVAEISILHKILPTLSESRLKLCFIEDLKKAAAADAIITSRENEMIEEFQQILEIYSSENLCTNSTQANEIMPEHGLKSKVLDYSTKFYPCSVAKYCSNRVEHKVGSGLCSRECSHRKT